MTIIDNDRPTRERVEKMHELIEELDAAQSAEVLALLTGMVMQAQISARAGGHVPPATEQEKTRAAELILRAYISQHPEALREKEETG